MSEFRFRSHERLKRPADFRRVYDRRCSAGDALMVVYGCKNDLAHSRLGLSVSRKVGNAVVRNRWKRLLRESYRLSRHEIPMGIDWVLIPRGSIPISLSNLMESMQSLTAVVARRLDRGKS